MSNKNFQLPPQFCTICGLKFQPNKGVTHASYCSPKCRTRASNKKQREEAGDWKPGKIECAICHKFYHKVGAHVYNEHKMIARTYREKYGFNVKRGQCSPELREVLSNNVFENGTVINLEAGKKYRFNKGDKVGKYKRSKETMEMLKMLHKKTQVYLKKHYS